MRERARSVCGMYVLYIVVHTTAAGCNQGRASNMYYFLFTLDVSGYDTTAVLLYQGNLHTGRIKFNDVNNVTGQARVTNRVMPQRCPI